MNDPDAAGEQIAEDDAQGADPDLSLNPHMGHLVAPDGDETPADDAADDNDQETDSPSDSEADTEDNGPADLQHKVGELAYENRQLKRELEQVRNASPGGDSDAEPEPLKVLKDFNYDEKAFNEYLVEETSSRTAAKLARDRVDTSARTAEQEADDRFAAREEAFDAENPGFSKRLHAKDLKITAEMAEFIRDPDSEVGLHVGDFLATNKKEAARIAALTPIGQAREMTKLETKIGKQVKAAAAAKAKASNAPRPPKGLNGEEPGFQRSPSDPKTADDMSHAEWLAARNKQLSR